MHVRISRPSRNTMQSGRGKTAEWVIECAASTPRRADDLIGWVGAGDTTSTAKKLAFPTLESAIAHATAQGWDYTVIPPQDRLVKPRNYVQNFKYRGEETA